MGTVGYMSPEQAAGQPVDFRSDQFSFGSILYEMVTGKRAFERATRPEILAAIIRAEPEPITALSPGVPAPVALDRRAVPRQGPKGPLCGDGGPRAGPRDPARARLGAFGRDAPPRARPHRAGRDGERWAWRPRCSWRSPEPSCSAGVSRGLSRSPPRFRQLTFRGAGISTARFAPGGQTVVYTAQFEGKPPSSLPRASTAPRRVRSASQGRRFSPSPPPARWRFCIAPRFGLLFQVPHSDLSANPTLLRGVLAEAPLAGGAPRELLEETYLADWSPDGKSLAVMRNVGGTNRLEFPAGRVLFEDNAAHANRISVSPSGDRVAFVFKFNLHVTEPGGVRDLHERAMEAVWCRATNEIWFNSVAGGATELFAIVPARPRRRVTTLPGDFVLHDISSDGRVLLGRVTESSEIFADFPGEARPRNLSHLDRSVAVALAPSGDTLLFNEMGQSDRSVYLRRTDGSPPKRLADGYAWALSPDGRFALVGPRPGPELLLVPPDPDSPDSSPRPGCAAGDAWGSFPTAEGSGSWRRIRRTNGGRGRWISTGGSPGADASRGGGMTLSGDGRFLCALAADGDWTLYSTETAQAHKVAGILPGEEPIQWTADGLLYVRGPNELRPGEPAITTRVYRLDPRTGRRELWKEIPPVNPSGGGVVGTIFFSADGKTCVSHTTATPPSFSSSRG